MQQDLFARKSGIDGLIANGQYLDGRLALLKELQESGNDSTPDYANHFQRYERHGNRMDSRQQP